MARPGHLAYVEWFSRPAASRRDANHRMYAVSRSMHKPLGVGRASSGVTVREASIIEVDTIRRSCHLFPKFGLRANRAWTSSNVLDRCETFLLNNWTDHHTYQTVY